MDVFKTVLSGLKARVEGCVAVSLIALDGIAVEALNDSSVPLESLGAEFGSFIKSILNANTELNTGTVEQFSLMTDRYTAVMSAVTPEYYILLILDPGGNYGRARFELSKAKFTLSDELS